MSGLTFALSAPLTGNDDVASAGFSYWGPLFPDYAAATFSSPALAATLSLGDPLTESGNWEDVVIRARETGSAGNAVTIEFTSSSIVPTGEIHEVGSAVQIDFLDGVTTIGDIASLINVSSTLVEMIGTWTPSELAIATQDEFVPTHLAGGLPVIAGTVAKFWGPNFPSGAAEATDFIPGTGPEGVATFALSMESGASVTYSWMTTVFKSYSGREQRVGLCDDPKQVFRGTASLVGSDSVNAQSLSVRAQLIRYAALGSVFLLGIPFEEISIADVSDAFDVPVNDSSADWMNPGQRVVIVDSDGDSTDFVEAVIQSATSTVVSLDQDAVAVARPGSRMMPTMPVFLDPQQAFARFVHPTQAIEQWSINARASTFGFRRAAIAATLSLGSPVTSSGVLDGATIRASTPGDDGNNLTIAFVGDSLGGVDSTDDGTSVTVRFEAGVSTVGEIAAVINTDSVLVQMIGSWEDNDVVVATDDEFDSTPLSGGSDEALAQMGVGAELTMYGDRPIFDRRVDTDDSASDTIQSMNDVVDLGGVPFSSGSALVPDWGRQVSIVDQLGPEFQWLKLFLFTVQGRRRSFWLPSYRADLLASGIPPGGGGGSGELLIDATVGDFFSWFPRYSMIQVVQESGVTYLLIEDAQDNGDGTITLSILADVSDPEAEVPPAEAVLSISWLELCRFESDDITVSFEGAIFSMSTNARVVQQ